MIEIRCFDSAAPAFPDELAGLLARNEEADSELMRSVARIIGEVREQGDAAVIKYTNRFDRRRARVADLEVPRAELPRALAAIPAELRAALESAATRIRSYHEKQLTESWSFEDADGVTLGQRVTPLDRVGVYVPGGKAAYPSTVLMSVIPGRVAGVGEMVMIVPAPDGELNPIVLAAAAIAGVDRVFSVGGAQGVAALAFGTDTIPQVDKIVGPGNRYVAAAKRQVFGVVGIDMIAGPSEVVVVSDGTPDPDWVAMDLFAQAEHDEDARAILVSLDGDFLERVRRSVEKLLPGMERAAVIRAAMTRNGAFIRAHGIDEVAGIVNRIAPEHLQLAVAEPGPLLENIRHAGAIFLGSHAAEVLGDYCAGPNHVLPTGRTARFSSPLGVYDFQKRSSIISCTPQGGAHLGGIAAVLARAEGLTAHARAAEFRIGGGKSGEPRQS